MVQKLSRKLLWNRKAEKKEKGTVVKKEKGATTTQPVKKQTSGDKDKEKDKKDKSKTTNKPQAKLDQVTINRDMSCHGMSCHGMSCNGMLLSSKPAS